VYDHRKRVGQHAAEAVSGSRLASFGGQRTPSGSSEHTLSRCTPSRRAIDACRSSVDTTHHCGPETLVSAAAFSRATVSGRDAPWQDHARPQLSRHPLRRRGVK
jgi:hypothetical protein